MAFLFTYAIRGSFILVVYSRGHVVVVGKGGSYKIS